jgi:GTP-binding protein
MKILKAEFLTSSPNLKSCPKTDLPEFAFIGRSNVGKSSLINMLVGRKNLAKVSQTPGKTRLINHFLINDEWMLVDLPGYGYAKLSKPEKEKIDRMIFDFLSGRQNLELTFQLIDSRHEMLANDWHFMEWLSAKKIPFAIILTKTDKISRLQLFKNTEVLNKAVKSLYQVPAILFSSSTKFMGKEEILDLVGRYVPSEM